MGSVNSFGALGQLDVGVRQYQIYRLAALPGLSRLPYSLKVLAENLLRNDDGVNVTAEQITALADWDPWAEPSREVQFTPARVLMQDFTGVPAVVDLAAMRDALTELDLPPSLVNPHVPTELVIDHSVQIDVAGRSDAFARNVELEYQRNSERYQFLKWGQQAFENFAVVPPGTGIVHQVNIEHLARVVMIDDDGGATGAGEPLAYLDTCVGTDSHTTMVGGLGVLGWGVGGIEAEAAMLGQPVSMLIPKVVGVKLTGDLPTGVTATDLVLTITERLRQHGVVGKFVEFFGEGVAQIPLANRATISNMSPEFGSTVAIFPIDDETLSYLRLTGRDSAQVELVEAYAKAQGLWHDPLAPGYVEPEYSEYLELDLGSIVPSIAGPKRPQDRIALADAKAAFWESLGDYLPVGAGPASVPPEVDEKTVSALQEGEEESFPASDPLAVSGELDARLGDARFAEEPGLVRSPSRAEVVPQAASSVTSALPQTLGSNRPLRHGDVVIASITSCTNTSNPSVMLVAGLLARNAAARGLSAKPWVKTSLAPGSKVVTDYLETAGLWPDLERLGFHLVGYGCATCIGNSGPLSPEVAGEVREHNLAAVAVLSGNRNFEGRINPDVKMNYLASPPLVVA
ncbi:MAG: aconitate hydratase AcnA, partial [Promicromonosporaceae bacterium]|nr:aconitate hydratase AcnA [Promicromonosporaceae bacterium]